MIECNLGNYEKLTLWMFFKLSFLHLISNGLNEVNINSLMYIDCGFIKNFIVIYLVKADNHLILSNVI